MRRKGVAFCQAIIDDRRSSLVRTVERAGRSTSDQLFSASPDFKDAVVQSVADGFDNYKDMAKQFFNNPKVQDGLATVLNELVYAGSAKRRHKGSSFPR